jgi:hypothetical protein
LTFITEVKLDLAAFFSVAYTTVMRNILYFLFVISIAFQGWANARPQEAHCMMKEMSMSAQMQSCDDEMPSCCKPHSALKKLQSSCKHTVDCQSGQVGVLGFVLNKPQLLLTAVYTPTLHSIPISPDSSNVWRPPELG